MNPEGGGCGEPRSCHCTPVWITTAKLHLKKKKKRERETKSCYIAQAVLRLLASSDPPMSASQSAGITDVSPIWPLDGIIERKEGREWKDEVV